jgi:mevalonate kinase
VAKFSDEVKGFKISGAGGGGYIVAISDQNIPGSVKIKIRSSR